MATTSFQFVMLAPVASIHVLNTAPVQRSKDVDGRDKPDHDREASRDLTPALPRKGKGRTLHL